MHASSFRHVHLLIFVHFVVGITVVMTSPGLAYEKHCDLFPSAVQDHERISSQETCFDFVFGGQVPVAVIG